MVEIKELTYILAIAREGSISRAAEKLYMSQPNLSQFLKNFEASIGTVLFYRTPSGVHPTYAGELFLEKIKEIDRSYQAAMRELKQMRMLELGVIRCGIPAAKSGIVAGIVLGIGRAIGEAMAIIMVSGNVPNMPESLFAPVRFLTTAIASEMSYAAVGSLWQQALYSVGLVLFLFIMIINVILNVCIKNRKEG